MQLIIFSPLQEISFISPCMLVFNNNKRNLYDAFPDLAKGSTCFKRERLINVHNTHTDTIQYMLANKWLKINTKERLKSRLYLPPWWEWHLMKQSGPTINSLTDFDKHVILLTVSVNLTSMSQYQVNVNVSCKPRCLHCQVPRNPHLALLARLRSTKGCHLATLARLATTARVQYPPP